MIRTKVNLLSKSFRNAYGDLYYKMPGKLKERDLTSTDSLVKTAYLRGVDHDPYVLTVILRAVRYDTFSHPPTICSSTKSKFIHMDFHSIVRKYEVPIIHLKCCFHTIYTKARLHVAWVH
jgi:hypothetical protein